MLHAGEHFKLDWSGASDVGMRWQAIVTFLLRIAQKYSFPRKVEAVTDVVFIIEYLCFLAAVRATPWLVFKFWALVDLLSLLPGASLFWTNFDSGGRRDSWAFVEVILLLRVVKVLDFPRFRRERFVVVRAIQHSAGLLVAPAFLAFHVWLNTSSFFMWWENYFDGPSRQYFTSIPTSMYWTCQFLLGEWVFADFSPVGQALCIFTVVFGMMIFSIPSGIFIEAVQTSLTRALIEDSTAEQIMLFQDDEGDKPVKGSKKKTKLNAAMRHLHMEKVLEKSGHD